MVKAARARRLVPRLRIARRGRHAPGQQQVQSAAPMPPVGKTHHRAPPHAQHLADDKRRIVEIRNRITQNHRVETNAPDSRAVPRADRPAAPSRRCARRPAPSASAISTPRPSDVLRVNQMAQQRSIAAAQVQHLFLRLDQIGDHAEVGAQVRSAHRIVLKSQPDSGRPRSAHRSQNVFTSRPRKLDSNSVIVSTSSRNASWPHVDWRLA